MEAYGETSDGTLLSDAIADVANNLLGRLMFSPANLRKSVYHSLNTNGTSDSIDSFKYDITSKEGVRKFTIETITKVWAAYDVMLTHTA